MTSPSAPPIAASNVLVGAGALYLAPKNTPLPPDSSVLFDPTNWTGKTLTLNAATAVTLSVTNSQGSQSTASLTNAATLTAAQLQAALQALSNVGTDPASQLPNVKVTGATPGGPFTVVFANRLGATALAVVTSTGGTTPTVTGGLWTPPGATESGWTFGASKSTQTINVEEQSTAVGKYIASQTVTIAGNVAEDTTANWRFALNAVLTKIAAASGQPGVDVLTMSDDLLHFAVALEAINEYGQPKRFYIPDATSAEALTVAFRRAAAQRMLNVSFEAVCETNRIVVRSVNSPALP